MRLLLALALLAISANAQWVRQKVDTTASFRGLAVVNEKVVWASGTGGTVIRTINGGKTWDVITVPGAEKLDFRDIEAFDANTAYILSIGNGDSSRIYKAIDGGKTWKLQFKNDDPKKFFDAIACMNVQNCIAMSDPVDGVFPLIFTSNGGEVWQSDEKIIGAPVAIAGEAAFAASGTCLITLRSTVLIVTGGSSARVLSGRRNLISVQPITIKGYSWEAADTPLSKGSNGSGIFSIAMFNSFRGVVVGGNYEKPDESNANLAFTTDRGRTWTAGKGLSGYRSGVAYLDRETIIAVGTNGTDVSRYDGENWKKIGSENLNAVQSKGKRATWAVGPNGTVVKLK